MINIYCLAFVDVSTRVAIFASKKYFLPLAGFNRFNPRPDRGVNATPLRFFADSKKTVVLRDAGMIMIDCDLEVIWVLG